ncbi:MAG TPA: YIP1 family protein [Candidatus Dormibacteraeota bacterium]|nr:YIP1 family protein [Candidatus Dormibacteraeota bacterium]
MATTTAVAPEAQRPINHFGRIIGALFAPRKTFEDIARQPSWIAPVLLMSIIGVGVAAMLNQRVNWGTFIRQKAEQNSRFAQLSEEQKDRALGVQIKYAPVFSYCIGGLGTILAVLVFALIYCGAFNLFSGAGLNYKTSLGISAHAYLPSAIAAILMLIILPLKGYGDVDPEHLVATNLGAFLGSDSPKWRQSLGTSLDIFWIWVLVLFAIGYSAANPRKIKTGTAFGIVFGLWAVWVLAKVSWAAI